MGYKDEAKKWEYVIEQILEGQNILLVDEIWKDIFRAWGAVNQKLIEKGLIEPPPKEWMEHTSSDYDSEGEDDTYEPDEAQKERVRKIVEMYSPKNEDINSYKAKNTKEEIVYKDLAKSWEHAIEQILKDQNILLVDEIWKDIFRAWGAVYRKLISYNEGGVYECTKEEAVEIAQLLKTFTDTYEPDETQKFSPKDSYLKDLEEEIELLEKMAKTKGITVEMRPYEGSDTSDDEDDLVELTDVELPEVTDEHKRRAQEIMDSWT